jgi:hypothetical protein
MHAIHAKYSKTLKKKNIEKMIFKKYEPLKLNDILIFKTACKKSKNFSKIMLDFKNLWSSIDIVVGTQRKQNHKGIKPHLYFSR